MNYSEILILRYLKPLETLADGWLVKCITAFALTVFSILTELFVTDGKLVLFLFIVVFVDLVTGVIASKKRKQFVTSMGLRQTVVKLIEYFTVLLLIAGVSNTFHDTVPLIEHLVTWAYFFAILTELKSILENIGDDKESKLGKLTNYIIDKIEEKLNGN